jgi:hypothetical protein
VRAALVVAAILLALEGVTRFQLFARSRDIRQFLSYPARATRLASGNGVRVAVLGNSVTHENIDPEQLADSLGRRDHVPVRADIISADHSYVDSWYFMLERYFWRPGNHVDMVVIPFWGWNLYDGNPMEVGRLAYFFTTLEQWTEVLPTLPTAAERLEWATSSMFASYAVRDRMREFAFTYLLPDYQGWLRLQQRVETDREETAPATQTRAPRSLDQLERLLRAAQRHGTRLCFVAVPTLHEEWNGPLPDVVALIAAAGMDYVDLRQLDVGAERFVDRVHMTPAGRALLTARLAERLPPLVPCQGAACPALAASQPSAYPVGTSPAVSVRRQVGPPAGAPPASGS